MEIKNGMVREKWIQVDSAVRGAEPMGDQNEVWRNPEAPRPKAKAKANAKAKASGKAKSAPKETGVARKTKKSKKK